MFHFRLFLSVNITSSHASTRRGGDDFSCNTEHIMPMSGRRITVHIGRTMHNISHMLPLREEFCCTFITNNSRAEVQIHSAEWTNVSHHTEMRERALRAFACRYTSETEMNHFSHARLSRDPAVTCTTSMSSPHRNTLEALACPGTQPLLPPPV